MDVIIVLAVGLALEFIVLYFTNSKINKHIGLIRNELNMVNQNQEHQFTYRPSKIFIWNSYINYKYIQIYT